jgi:hypothetical protein
MERLCCTAVAEAPMLGLTPISNSTCDWSLLHLRCAQNNLHYKSSFMRPLLNKFLAAIDCGAALPGSTR